jgi:hypothetical protein
MLVAVLAVAAAVARSCKYFPFISRTVFEAVQLTVTPLQSELEQILYSGEPLPLIETLTSQLGSVPLIGKMFDVVSALATNPFWSVKSKAPGEPSHVTVLKRQAHEAPSQNCTQDPAGQCLSAPARAASQASPVVVPTITSPST